jgi:HEPN domain-containing protein
MSLPPEHASALMARARDDHYVVRSLRAEPDAPVWVLGFHAQQAVEKALKAVLSACGIAYPRTHNLVMLAELLRRERQILPPDADAFGMLVPFGVALRYDDAGGDPPQIDTVWLEQLVARTIEWASTRIKEKN